MAQQIAVALIAIATVAALYRRPRGLADWQIVGLGAAAALSTGVLPPAASASTLRHGANILAFFLGLMLLNGAAATAGFYPLIARMLERIPLPVPLGVLATGAPVTAVLSNDATPLLLTPAIFRLRAVAPSAAAYAVTFTADIGSMVLPISNPVALLFWDRLEMTPGQYLRTGTLPGLAALAALTLVLFVQTRRAPAPICGDAALPAAARSVLPATRAFRIAFGLLAVILCLTYVLATVLGLPLGAVCLGGGLATLLMAAATGAEPHEIVARVQPGVLVLVAGLLLLIDATEAAGLLDWLASTLEWLAERPALPMLAGALLLSATLANTVNNWPAALALVTALEGIDGEVDPLLLAACLAGCTIGANATVYGSLSTVLWLALMQGNGTHITPMTYARRALIPTLFALAAAALTAWALRS